MQFWKCERSLGIYDILGATKNDQRYGTKVIETMKFMSLLAI